tara:strand:+ start:4819 stop:4956 length:138 start_codon:yes stop_codon:yes gene_type:complete
MENNINDNFILILNLDRIKNINDPIKKSKKGILSPDIKTVIKQRK